MQAGKPCACRIMAHVASHGIDGPPSPQQRPFKSHLSVIYHHCHMFVRLLEGDAMTSSSKATRPYLSVPSACNRRETASYLFAPCCCLSTACPLLRDGPFEALLPATASLSSRPNSRCKPFVAHRVCAGAVAAPPKCRRLFSGTDTASCALRVAALGGQRRGCCGTRVER